jgi:serine/threonine protein kinase
MYAMLAGRPPFTAEEPLSIIHQVVNNVPVSLREMKEQCSREVVPIWLSDVVDRILARDPDDRPQSAVELRQCLEVVQVSGTPDSLILVPLEGHQNGPQKETTALKECSA